MSKVPQQWPVKLWQGATMARVHPDHISYSAALAALKQENLWKTSLGFLTRASTRAARVNPGTLGAKRVSNRVSICVQLCLG